MREVFRVRADALVIASPPADASIREVFRVPVSAAAPAVAPACFAEPAALASEPYAAVAAPVAAVATADTASTEPLTACTDAWRPVCTARVARIIGVGRAFITGVSRWLSCACATNSSRRPHLRVSGSPAWDVTVLCLPV